MAYIEIGDINALVDGTKLTFADVDLDLLSSIVVEAFMQLQQLYDTTVWVDKSSTPKLVVKILAMLYVGWYYERVYSEDGNPNSYGLLQIARAQRLIDGIVSQSIDLIDSITPSTNQNDSALFYPNDASSAMDPTDTSAPDTSVGPAYFSMGAIF